MRVLRSATAVDPLRFGRRDVQFVDDVPAASAGMSDDLRLFANTFAIGFLFVAVFIF